jgi:hypothetical protein
MSTPACLVNVAKELSMCKRWFLLALVGLGVGLSALLSGPAPAGDDADRIARLVKQLGSSRFAERDRAKRELEALGPAAFEALRQAAQSKDPETSRRAGDLVKKMQEKIDLANLLAPKKVRLNLKDTPVLDAVADLARQSGYSVELLGDRAALAGRKITLDTGETSFWEALDRLCEKAGLVETSTPYARPVPQPTIRIQPLPVQPVQPGVKPAPKPAPPAPPRQRKGAGQLRIEVKVEAVQLAAPAQGPVQAQPAQPQGAPAQAVQPPQHLQPPVQIQPAPLLQIQPGGLRRPTPIRPYNPSQITLTEGKRQDTPTCYSGAVRVRVASAVPQQYQAIPAASPRAGEALILLEVAAEPRLQNFQLLGSAQIDKALDDQGQKLSMPMEPMPGEGGGVVGPGGVAIGRTVYNYNPYNAQNRIAYVRLKLGEKQAKTLKELSGHLSAQMLSPPQALITVTDVLKSAGQKFTGKGGGAIEMLSVEKQADGSYKVRFRLENPPSFIAAPFQGPVAPLNAQPVPPAPVQGGNLQLRVAPGGRVMQPYYNTHGLPTLTDARGRSYQLTQPPQRIGHLNAGGTLTLEVTMDFRAHDGQDAPARLVLHGQRNTSVQVPFTLRDVTLP